MDHSLDAERDEQFKPGFRSNKKLNTLCILGFCNLGNSRNQKKLPYVHTNNGGSHRMIQITLQWLFYRLIYVLPKGNRGRGGDE